MKHPDERANVNYASCKNPYVDVQYRQWNHEKGYMVYYRK